MMWRASTGQPREYRVTNAVLGKHSMKVLESVGKLLSESARDPQWIPYTAELGKSDLAAFEAWKCLVRAGAVVFLRFETRRSQFPLLVFKLLREGNTALSDEEVREFAQKFLGLCEKVLGPFGLWVKRKFPTLEQLTSPSFRARFIAMAILIRLNIAIVERGHSQNRRGIVSVGSQGRAVPLSTVSSIQEFRLVNRENDWLGDRSPPPDLPPEDQVEVLGNQKNLRGPHVWNQFLMETAWGPALPTRELRDERLRALRTQFEDLPDEDLLPLVDRTKFRLQRKQAGDPDCTATANARRRTERLNQRREGRVLLSLHLEAGELLRGEIQEMVENCIEIANEQRALEEERAERTRRLRASTEALDDVCNLCEDFLDMREHLTPLVAGDDRLPGEPTVLFLSTVPKDTPGAVSDAVWQKLADASVVRQKSNANTMRHVLVKSADARLLKSPPRLSYCFRATGGRCVCGENIRFLLIFKRLRKMLTMYMNLQLEKAATEVFEICGPGEDQAPDAEDRLFFHISARIGDHRAFLRLSFLEERAERIMLRTVVENRIPKYYDMWLLAFFLLDSFPESPFTVQFYRVEVDGRSQDPWEIRDVAVRRRAVVDNDFIKSWKCPNYYYNIDFLTRTATTIS
jgi:hypothetical protein